MNNFNIDENSMNKLKDMMNSGDFSNVLSQISPETIQNLSSIINSSKSNTTTNQTTTKSNSNNKSNNNFDLNNIDPSTILKVKSVLENMNNTNDPRYNLLTSLKPYLRESRKDKVDQYANLLNVAKIAELFKNNDKENHINE